MGDLLGRLIGSTAFPKEAWRKPIRPPVGSPVPHLERDPPPVGVIEHLQYGHPGSPRRLLTGQARQPWGGWQAGRC